MERGSDSTRSLNTAASAVAFHTANAEEATCIFCHRNDHRSKDCFQFTVEIRRDELKRMGQCYVCLGDKHLARNCRAQGVTCSECVHRHHKQHEVRCYRKLPKLNPLSLILSKPYHSTPLIATPPFLQTARVWVETHRQNQIVRC